MSSFHLFNLRLRYLKITYTAVTRYRFGLPASPCRALLNFPLHLERVASPKEKLGEVFLKNLPKSPFKDLGCDLLRNHYFSSFCIAIFSKYHNILTWCPVSTINALFACIKSFTKYLCTFHIKHQYLCIIFRKYYTKL